MKLFEYEGKQLLKAYGVNIPNGVLYSQISTDGPEVEFPLFAKAQVLTGGRGKLGGIKRVDKKVNLKGEVSRLLKMNIKDESVLDVYLEQPVEYTRELYLSIVIDRNSKIPLLVVANAGGMEIENVPSEEILKIPLNPFIGLKEYMFKQVSNYTQLDYQNVKDFITKIYDLFTQTKSTLVEVNPLFITPQQELIAADAKIIIEDTSKLTSYNIDLISRKNNSFEAKCLELNTVGVHLGNGDTAVITSGAGLGMATFDLLTASNYEIEALVDLGGHVIHDVEGAKNLIKEIEVVNPKNYFFNFYFQVASCTVLAKAIVNVLGKTNKNVVVRMKGKDFAEAKEILEPYFNITTTEDISDALQLLETKVG